MRCIGTAELSRMDSNSTPPNTALPRCRAAAPPRRLDELRTAIRLRHYPIRTETAYVDWARLYNRFHSLRHPREMGSAEVVAFLSNLAVHHQVSASTQSQARAALLFLYKQVLGIDLPSLKEVVAARPSRRLPVVLTPGEAAALRSASRNSATIRARRNQHALIRSSLLRSHLPRSDWPADTGQVT